MAVSTVDHETEVREALASVTKFFQKYEARAAVLTDIVRDFKELRAEVVNLLNQRENLCRLNKDAQARLASAEKEAQERLSTMEMGHRDLIDRLSKQKVELDKKADDLEKREDAARIAVERAEIERNHYERKIASLTDIKTRK